MTVVEPSPSADTSDPRGSGLLPLDAARRIDAICERFERALQAGQPATIEDSIAETGHDGLESTALLGNPVARIGVSSAPRRSPDRR